MRTTSAGAPYCRGCSCGSRIIAGIDGKFRLFRYGHWIPAQWREFHELYEFARMRGWQREQLVYGAGTFSHPACRRAGVPEDAAAHAPRLGQLHAGSGRMGGPAAGRLDAVADAGAAAGRGAPFFVDLTGPQGLRRRDGCIPAGASCFLTPVPSTRASSSGCAGCPSRTTRSQPGELPAREQRLLLMRLASLFGPDAIAQAPRAPRASTMPRSAWWSDCRRSRARSPKSSGCPTTRERRGSPRATTRSRRWSIRATRNRSRAGSAAQPGGWRTAANRVPAHRTGKDAPSKLGEIVAIKEGDLWALAVVRRMQRHQVDEVTVGIEVIARRLVRVLMRSWVAPTEAAAPSAERPFFGIYLPAHRRTANPRSGA